MTPSIRKIYVELLTGVFLVYRCNPKGQRQYKIYRGNMIPVRWVKDREYQALFHLVRWENKHTKKRLVIDLQAVRRLHGGSTFKQLYKLHRGKKPNHPGQRPDGITEVTGSDCELLDNLPALLGLA